MLCQGQSSVFNGPATSITLLPKASPFEKKSIQMVDRVAIVKGWEGMELSGTKKMLLHKGSTRIIVKKKRLVFYLDHVDTCTNAYEKLHKTEHTDTSTN